MIQPPGFWLTFLYYFAVTNLIVVAIVSGRLGMNWLDPSLYQLSVVIGLMTGLLGATLNRSVTVTAPVKGKVVFLKTLNEELAAMDFQPISELESFTFYQKPSIASLFAGKIFVKIESKSATIIGRANVIKQLVKNSTLKFD
jgi:hypothetical protein